MPDCTAYERSVEVGRTKVITEGALMLALFTVLLLISVYVPILSVVGVIFLLLPFFIYSAKYGLGPALMMFVGSVAVTFIIAGPVALPVVFMYGITGVVIGTMVRRKYDNWMIYMAGSLTFLLNIIIQYIATIQLLGLSVVDQLGDLVKQSMNDTSAMLESAPVYTPEQIDAAIQYINDILPALFVVTAFFIVFLLMLINYPIAKRLGIQTKPLNPFRTVRLPRSILWYYLFFMIGALLVKPEEGTLWYDIYINVMFILQACLYIQGLSFVFFFAHRKKWPKAIPVIIAILSIPVIPVLYLIRLLGIIDLGFDLRQRMQKKP
ncbi:hypothetical protein BTO30_10250 [Domibacillus antri]|uniref:DUF2232 domain-containing protein n=1 Tax=Domibacillus antri TaxID=1714264 RepID=A0A1Q8Q4U4_9BACI|nr:YybS family protein [Domibacillus antri]OLN22315.1 hypothetical protein BTO30_10250 [Domibacillus antri]